MLTKIILFTVIAGLSVLNLNSDRFWFDSKKITQGELWRLVACHFVHSSFSHLLLNLVFLAILILSVELKKFINFFIIAAFVIGVGLAVTLDAQYSYGGLSGILYGMTFLAIWEQRRNLPISAYYAGLVALTAKLIWDLWNFPSPAMSNSESVLIPHAHLLGALTAGGWILVDVLKKSPGVAARAAVALPTLILALSFAVVPRAVAVEAGVASVHEHSLSTIPWVDYRRLSFYGGIGFVRGSASQAEIEKGVNESGITLDEFSINVNRPGYHLGFAYEISDNLHLEMMYFNFGKVMVEASSTGITEDQLADAFRERLPGTGAGPLVSLKINKWVRNPFHRIFARAGTFWASSGYDLTGNVSIKRKETSFVLGGGYEYFYRKGLSIRGELNYSSLNGENVFYIGPTLVVYLDGVPREKMPEPAPVIPEPPRPSAKPESLKLTIYFDFDKFDVRTSEYSKVREIKDFMERYPSAVVILTGHTDSYGTKDYNVKLSENRIQAVKSALIKKEEIASDRIRTSVHGEDAAADSNWTDEGRQSNRRVNACVVDQSVGAEEICLGLEVAKTAPTGDLKFVCRKDSQEARIEARHAGTAKGGCAAYLQLPSQGWKRLGSAFDYLEKCMGIVERQRAKLEAQGYACEHVPEDAKP